MNNMIEMRFVFHELSDEIDMSDVSLTGSTRGDQENVALCRSFIYETLSKFKNM